METLLCRNIQTALLIIHPGLAMDNNVMVVHTIGKIADGMEVIVLNSICSQYPDCNVYYYPYWLGDGNCNGDAYNATECGWDDGDCVRFNLQHPDCNVDDPDNIGDGTCHGGAHNTEACGWDGGDCAGFNEQYPGCNVYYPYWLGDGNCNGDAHNTPECGWDDGDCLE